MKNMEIRLFLLFSPYFNVPFIPAIKFDKFRSEIYSTG